MKANTKTRHAQMQQVNENNTWRKITRVTNKYIHSSFDQLQEQGPNHWKEDQKQNVRTVNYKIIDFLSTLLIIFSSTTFDFPSPQYLARGSNAQLTQPASWYEQRDPRSTGPAGATGHPHFPLPIGREPGTSHPQTAAGTPTARAQRFCLNAIHRHGSYSLYCMSRNFRTV